MANEREDVIGWIRLEYSYMSGIALPTVLCERCLHELFSFFSALETLEEILALGLHPCDHTYTATTVLNAAINGDSELLERLAAELNFHGWSYMPDFLTGRAGDSPTIH